MNRRMWLSLVPLLLWSLSAQAESVDATAKRLFVAGMQAYDAGRYDLAIKAFEAAYVRAPAELLLFDLAQAYRKKFVTEGDASSLDKAITLYRRFMSTPGPAHERTVAAEALSELLLLAARQPQQETPKTESKSEPEARKTEVMIVSESADATAALDDHPPSPVPLLETVTPGEHRARVTATGYVAAELRVMAVEGRLMVSEARLQPLPSTLEVLGPRGALLQLDDRDAGVLPLTAQQLPAGTHHLMVRLRGHVPWDQTVALGRGAQVQLHTQLRSTTQRRAVPWLGVAAAIFGVGAIAAGAVAGAADSAASDIYNQLSSGQITLAQRDDYYRNRSVRDQATTAFGVTCALGAGLAITTIALYLFDRR
jgi:hypothetical protein